MLTVLDGSGRTAQKMVLRVFLVNPACWPVYSSRSSINYPYQCILKCMHFIFQAMGVLPKNLRKPVALNITTYLQ